MSETAFCYHCGTYHAVEEMRQTLTKAGKRWRCIRSIEASNVGIAKRDAFGKQFTAINKVDAKAKRRTAPNPGRHSDS
jgi:hydrogenase maturation factor